MIDYWDLVASKSSTTGIAMIVILGGLLAYSTRFSRKNEFEIFWGAHAMWPLFLGCCLFHGADELFEK